MNQPRLEDLLNRRVDGALAEADRRELERLLLDSSDARDAFWRFAGLHSLIRDNFQSRRGRREAAEAAPPIIMTSNAGLSDGAWPSGIGWLSGTGPLSYLVATVILGLMLLSAWAYKISHDYGPTLATNSRGLTAPGESAPPSPAPVFVARVTGMSGCRWADAQTETYPGAFVPLGRKYVLSSGLMEITYLSGAKVILEGPCSYIVESTAGGFLALGKLTARVESGEGRGESAKPRPKTQDLRPKTEISKSPNPRNSKSFFSIRTPTALITDLGTEFGVEVSPDGKTDAFVLDGVVRVSAASPTPKNRTLICRAGELARVEPGNSGVRAIEPEKDFAQRFVKAMPRPMEISGAYADYVLSLGPAVYYRMEKTRSDAERFVVFDSAGGGHHGELRLGDEYGGPPYREGRFGDALSLRGPEVGDRAIVPDYPKATGDRLTVAAWVYATGQPGWAMIAANWGANIEGRNNWGQFHLGLFQRDGDLSARLTQRNGEYVEVREGEPLPLYQWQHVALTLDGNTARLYRNGKEVGRCHCDGLLPAPPLAALGIGCHLNQTGSDSGADSAPGHQYWQGRIDELAIFNRALGAREIEQLYLGRSGKPPAETTPNKENQ